MERRNAFSRAHKTRVALHLVAAVHLSYAIYFDFNYTEMPSLAVELQLEPPLGGKFKYLTNIVGILQAAYYQLALIHDMLGGRMLRRLRDYMLATYTVPLALTVSVTFWVLYGINREFIYPKVLDLVFPNWLNQALHTYVVVYALAELCVTQHRYPSRFSGIAGLIAFICAYLIWILLLWYSTNVWVYPFLDALSWPLRLIFFVTIVGLCCIYYLLGQHINLVLWVKGNACHQKITKTNWIS